MSVVVSITNQKGGVGKTVTVSSMGAALTEQGYKVLLINLDPQRNLDMVAGKDIAIKRSDTVTPSILNVLKGECSIEDAIISTRIGDLVRASSQLSQWTGRPLMTKTEYEQLDRDGVYQLVGERLKNGWSGNDTEVLNSELVSVRDKYDYILMDTNPSLTLLTLNSLFAAKYVLIPAFTESASRDAITELWDTIKGINFYNPAKQIKIVGILITNYVARSINSKRYIDFFEKLASKMDTVVFQQKIRRSVSVTEYMTNHMDLLHYDRKGNTAQDYLAFVEEFKSRIAYLEAKTNGR